VACELLWRVGRVIGARHCSCVGELKAAAGSREQNLVGYRVAGRVFLSLGRECFASVHLAAVPPCGCYDRRWAVKSCVVNHFFP
jgi:hypothetical protein